MRRRKIGYISGHHIIGAMNRPRTIKQSGYVIISVMAGGPGVTEKAMLLTHIRKLLSIYIKP